MPDPTPPETLTPNQKISAGLAVNPSPRVGFKPASYDQRLVFGSPDDITAASATLETTTTKYRLSVEAIGKEAEKERTQLASALTRAGLSPDEVRAKADVSIDKFCRDKLREAENEFAEHAKQIQTILARTDASLEASSSPVSMLAVVGLHEKEREHYNIAKAKVDAAGPAGLVALSNHAVSNVDKVLGAALADRLNAMTADERRTAKAHGVADLSTLGEIFCGKPWRARRLTLLRIQQGCRNALDYYMAQIAYIAGRRAEPKKTPHEFIESGLREKTIERLAAQVAADNQPRQ